MNLTPRFEEITSHRQFQHGPVSVHRVARLAARRIAMTGPSEMHLVSTQQGALDDEHHPRLTDHMLLRLSTRGIVRTVPSGTVLFKRGRLVSELFVVLEGLLEFRNGDAGRNRELISCIGEKQFSGELDLLNNQSSMVTCTSCMDSRVLVIPGTELRVILKTDVEIATLLLKAWIGRRLKLLQRDCAGVVIIGEEDSGELLKLQQFLSRNGYPFKTLLVSQNAEARPLLDLLGVDADGLPAVICPDRSFLCRPPLPRVAEALGLNRRVEYTRLYDVAIVGGGPAGLASAVYAASEGLSAIVIEAIAPGGQADTSSKIENYLGFPVGFSGQELAELAHVQARKFGADVLIAHEVTCLVNSPGHHMLLLRDAPAICSRSVIIASGARYRRLNIPGFDMFETEGIHFAATPLEAELCRDCEVAIVGAGNSAGQAAVFLAQFASRVHLIFRGPALGSTMSDYLVQRILSSPCIELHGQAEITDLAGERRLEAITWRNHTTGTERISLVSHLFVMIGAEPNSQWLNGTVRCDGKGFILTGQPCDAPSVHQTSCAGVFAVGDIRSGSVKRVASAVGEGSVVIAEVHQYLSERPN